MNQNPEQIARNKITRHLIACGWVIQDKVKINLNGGIGAVSVLFGEGMDDFIHEINEALDA